MKGTRFVNSFAEKILVLGKWDILGIKMLISVDLLKSLFFSFFFFKKSFLHNEKGQEVFLFFFLFTEQFLL